MFITIKICSKFVQFPIGGCMLSAFRQMFLLVLPDLPELPVPSPVKINAVIKPFISLVFAWRNGWKSSDFSLRFIFHWLEIILPFSGSPPCSYISICVFTVCVACGGKKCEGQSQSWQTGRHLLFLLCGAPYQLGFYWLLMRRLCLMCFKKPWWAPAVLWLLYYVTNWVLYISFLSSLLKWMLY